MKINFDQEAVAALVALALMILAAVAGYMIGNL